MNLPAGSADEFLALDEQKQTDALALLIENAGVAQACALFEQIAQLKSLQMLAAQENEVLLASQSPRRKQILGEVLGVPHRCEASVAQELQPSVFSVPQTVTQTIALMKLLPLIKAGAVNASVVLTFDTMIHLEDGTVLGKPQGTTLAEQLANARDMLLSLLNEEQAVSSSVVTFDAKTNRVYCKEHTALVRFKPYTAELEKIIEGYVNLAAAGISHRGPLGKAGGYGIQEPEILAITAEICGDVFAVVGLPLSETRELLECCGIQPAQNLGMQTLYENLWGATVWRDQKIYLPSAQIPPDFNFVPVALALLH
jgi:septum formation protein